MFEVLAREYNVGKVNVLDELPTTLSSTKEVKPLKRSFDDEGGPGVLTSRIQKEVRGHTSFLTLYFSIN